MTYSEKQRRKQPYTGHRRTKDYCGGPKLRQQVQGGIEFIIKDIVAQTGFQIEVEVLPNGRAGGRSWFVVQLTSLDRATLDLGWSKVDAVYKLLAGVGGVQ
jgi:hypothetical protein